MTPPMYRLLAVLAFLVPAAAQAQSLPKTGSVRQAAYIVCHSVAILDLGAVGSNSAADCRGIVKALDGTEALDNLAAHCLETSEARKAGYEFVGACKETDKAGDALYLRYEGAESGAVSVLGGTGKFRGLTGKGQWSVADAPGNTPQQFAFTLTYGFDWNLP